MVEGIADRRMQTRRRRRRRREAAREEEDTPRRAQLLAPPIVAFVSPACRGIQTRMESESWHHSVNGGSRSTSGS